ncbi:MAG: hypothetical protein H6660_10850 [Ardenticatenaceae bacterium]|nr:hypothetical protein [Ardenticatenaceae bacterium]
MFYQVKHQLQAIRSYHGLIRWLPILALFPLLFSIFATSNALADETQSLRGQQWSLSLFLNEDGTLNLPSGGIEGSIDPSGYQLISAPGEAPRFSANTAVTTLAGSDDANWDPRFAGNMLNGPISALAWDGTNLYAGGTFTSPSPYIARWDGSSWSALGTGVNGTVRAFAWDAASNTLFVGASSRQPGATRLTTSPVGMVLPGRPWTLV